ncbi:MAG: 16S rRNA (uracil(1498)-N(3))-methyltransferase [Deinococcaceae bacterium]
MVGLHRVKVSGLVWGPDGLLNIYGPEVHHLHVLRKKKNQEVFVFDGLGQECRARILDISPSVARLERLEDIENHHEMPQKVTLCVALLKGDKLSDVVRAATELGVFAIQLMVTQYADATEIGDAKLNRLRRIAEEASKQCRRAVVPEVRFPIHLRELPQIEQGYVAHPVGQPNWSKNIVWDKPIWLASGPEGGFHDSEIDFLQQQGFGAVSLGQRILRAETAPVAMLGAIAALGV